MQGSRVPLEKIHPSWKGVILSSTYDAVMRGIEREKMRLSGSPFIAFEFLQEYDYDGVEESLQLLEGFVSLADAVNYIEERTRFTQTVSLAELRMKNSAWRHDPDRDKSGIEPHRRGCKVKCIHRRFFGFTDDSGYNTKLYRQEVLAVDVPDVIGPDLFTYCDAQEEWVDYFRDKGKE